METVIRYIDKETLREYKDRGIGLVEVVVRSVAESCRTSETNAEIEILVKEYYDDDIPF